MAETIDKDHMQIIDSASDYGEAIRTAAKPLERDGYITDTYIDEMIEALEEHGPYIVLAEEFALPHARPSEAVKETALSLLTVKNGVDVKGHFVRLFIVLAAKDSTSHNRLLQGLAEFLMEPKNIQDVIACNTTDEIDHILEERWNTT